MTLFSLLGFTRVEKQLNTAFKFLRDPEPMSELNKMWAIDKSKTDIVQRKEPSMKDAAPDGEF